MGVTVYQNKQRQESRENSKAINKLNTYDVHSRKLSHVPPATFANLYDILNSSDMQQQAKAVNVGAERRERRQCSKQ